MFCWNKRFIGPKFNKKDFFMFVFNLYFNQADKWVQRQRAVHRAPEVTLMNVSYRVCPESSRTESIKKHLLTEMIQVLHSPQSRTHLHSHTAASAISSPGMLLGRRRPECCWAPLSRPVVTLPPTRDDVLSGGFWGGERGKSLRGQHRGCGGTTLSSSLESLGEFVGTTSNTHYT